MSAAVAELRVPRIDPVGGALRLGVLYDLLGRTIDEDVRKVTVARFLERYRIERAHAARVSVAGAFALPRRAPRERAASSRSSSSGRALLHETGMSVSHLGFHKHGAYILQHADMPGFSAGEQNRLALLVVRLPGWFGQGAGVRCMTRSARARSWRCAWRCCFTTRAPRSRCHGSG